MAKTKAFGSDLLKGNTSDYTTSTTWTSVGCVSAIRPPNPSVEDVEIPKCVNDESLAKEYVPGAYDPGEAGYSILYDSAGGDLQDGLDALGEEGAWAIKLGNTTNHYAFNGYFKGLSMPEITSDGFIALDATVKVSGEPAEITIP